MSKDEFELLNKIKKDTKEIKEILQKIAERFDIDVEIKQKLLDPKTHSPGKVIKNS